MALNAGDAACTTGLSKRFYDAISAKWLPGGYTPGPEWMDVCHAFATAVVDEIQANAALSGAVATVETTGTYAGIQRDPVSGTNCLEPTIAKTIPVTGGIS